MVELSPGAKLLKEWFPFTEVPLVVNAPMWQIATQKLAVGVTAAGGLGFVGAGPETKYISGYLDKIDKIIQMPEDQRGDHPELFDPNVKEDKTDYDPIELQKLRAAVANSVKKDSKTAETLGYRLRTDLDPDVESDEIETKQFGSVEAKKPLLPIGVGIICFVADLRLWIDSLRKNTPCAVWMFGPRNTEEFVLWITTTKKIYPHTKLFIQIGSVTELSVVLKGDAGVYVDGIIAQGVADAGGHGINQGASIVALVPQFRREVERLKKHPRKYVEQNRVIPIIAAGGIMTGRGLAAALVLGADGVALGTRFILSKECTADPEQKRFLAKVRDGGQQTIRTRLYDTLRENGAWAPEYNGRSLINDSWFAHVGGMSEEENRRLYAQANQTATKNWNRLTLYCGTGVGLANEVLSAEDIARDIREKALRVLAVTVASNPAPPKIEGDDGGQQTFVSLAALR